jgi:hypothetical protein
MTALLMAPQGHRWVVVFALVLAAGALASDGRADGPDDTVGGLHVGAGELWAAVVLAIRGRGRVVVP